MLRDWSLYLDDILDACARVAEYTEGLSREEFQRDRKTFDATVRNLEIIGEASKHLPDHILVEMPEIEWRKAAGLRDYLAHAYFGLNPVILWDVITGKIPALQKAVAGYVKRASKS